VFQFGFRLSSPFSVQMSFRFVSFRFVSLFVLIDTQQQTVFRQSGNQSIYLSGFLPRDY